MTLRNSIRFPLTRVAVAWVLCVWVAAAAPQPAAVNLVGTWKVTTTNPKTKIKVGTEETLKLKLEGGKLTGTITHRSDVNGKQLLFESQIKDGHAKGGDLTFAVSHPPHIGNGPDFNQTYKGKLLGDTLKGQVECEWSGNTFTRDWEAKRVKP